MTHQSRSQLEYEKFSLVNGLVCLRMSQEWQETSDPITDTKLDYITNKFTEETSIRVVFTS